MERRIIVAIDLKEDSEKALHWFMDNVLKEGDEVHVVHVAKLKVCMPFYLAEALTPHSILLRLLHHMHPCFLESR